MEDNVYTVTKKMKILLGISVPIEVITMIMFLAAVAYKKSNVFIYISLVLFILAVLFLMVVVCYILAQWFKKYKEKYKGL